MNKLTYLCTLAICVLFLDLSPVIASTLNEANYRNEIQRVRLDFTMPNGYIRHLLLGFTPNNAATDGVDYGYDTLNMDSYPSDLSWMIEGQPYIIQGVGEFNVTKTYPLGMFLIEGGTIEITLASLENFDSPIEVFFFDSVLNTYTAINDVSFAGEFTSGDYLNRFFIAFDNNEANLSIDEQLKPTASMKYNRNSQELTISANTKISSIEVYNILGKLVFDKSHVYSETINVRFNHIQSPYVLIRMYTHIGIITKKVLLK